jgi:alpha-L-rhamnosidase
VVAVPLSAPTGLRVEHRGAAELGLGTARPRLSWQLPHGAARQTACEIEVVGGPTHRAETDRQLLVPWRFPPVRSRERITWRVRVETDAGPTEWSAPAWFETGLLEPDDWSARWIEPQEERPLPPSGSRPAQLLRHRFPLDASPGVARLHATAHGIYEAFLNGQRVGDHELSPGLTSYPHILHVQTFDVGDLLVAGTNLWEVVLSDGWYRGRQGNWQESELYGDSLAFLAQLEVDGTVVGTGPEWESAAAPIRAADLMAGQAEDHRYEPRGWRPVRVVDHDMARLTASPAPPVRRTELIPSRSVRRLTGDRQVVDLGQNINGWVRLGDLGPAGTELNLLHGEALDGAGDVTTEHLRSGDVPLGQVDRVVSAGRPGEVFEPRHTTHGFQYVRVEGHPGRLTTDDVTGVVVHTDLRRTGWFHCSDERVNRLHEIADWSFRGNACAVPTDCPHRERSAWTGDWQVFQPTAAFLYDVAGFSVKWLRDLAAEQLPDGLVCNFAPDPRWPKEAPAAEPTWTGMFGSSGWGDACVIVPDDLHRLYGDEEVLAELWPTMVRWMEWAATAARTKRHPRRAEERPEPAPHEQFLWDGGWHWGEWCEPDAGGEPFYSADQGSVGTAYLHHSARRAARIGRLLGHDEESARLDQLAAGALDAWRDEYLGEDGSLTPDTQANHVRALAFELVPDELRARTAARLVGLIREAGTHVGTGFLATPDLLPVLADTGHLDVAYELLLQDTQPSWLAMVDRGATTIWEEWEGIDADGVAHASLNHYSKGAVISFLHRYVAGIRPGLGDEDVAYRRFRIEPRPGGGITSAEAVHDCPYGRIESSWRIEGGTFSLTTTVPPGTTATLVLPDGTHAQLAPGSAHHTCLAR